MKLSYPLYHLYKCTKKNKSGYNYLPFCREQENVCRWKTTFLNYQEEAQQPKTLNSLQGRNISYKPCQTANLLQSELKLHEHSKDTTISKGKGRRSVTWGKKKGFQISLVPAGMNHPGLTRSQSYCAMLSMVFIILLEITGFLSPFQALRKGSNPQGLHSQCKGCIFLQ